MLLCLLIIIELSVACRWSEAVRRDACARWGEWRRRLSRAAARARGPGRYMRQNKHGVPYGLGVASLAARAPNVADEDVCSGLYLECPLHAPARSLRDALPDSQIGVVMKIMPMYLYRFSVTTAYSSCCIFSLPTLDLI